MKKFFLILSALFTGAISLVIASTPDIVEATRVAN